MYQVLTQLPVSLYTNHNADSFIYRGAVGVMVLQSTSTGLLISRIRVHGPLGCLPSA